MNIATMIRQLAGDSGKGMGFTVGTVTAVDKTARTVTCSRSMRTRRCWA